MEYLIYILLFSILGAIDDTIEIDASSFTEWKYFTFNSGLMEEVIITEPTSSCQWDLGIMRNHFKTNSGTSGNCNGGAYVDSSVIFTDNTWTDFTYIQNDIEFTEDGILNNLYDINSHTFSESPGSNVLETWGWFDLINNYQFMNNNYKFIIQTADGLNGYKVWVQDYYNELGQSAQIQIRYNTDINFIVDCNEGLINVDGVCTYLNYSENMIPHSYKLLPPFPNPFNPITTITFTMPKFGFVSIIIYDISGSIIKTIIDEHLNLGFHSIIWDGTNQPSGIYFVKMEIDGYFETKKILLTK